MFSRKRIIKTVLIVFLLVTIAGTFSSLPANENMFSDSVPEIDNSEIQESIKSSDKANLELMMFVPTASNDGGVYYVCRRGTSSIAYFGVSNVHYLVDDVYFTLEFPGSNQVIPEGEKPTGSVTNYFFGSDSSQWRKGLADFEVLRYRELYPGIDLIYKIHDGFLKYEFAITPHSNPSSIRMRYTDADEISVCDDQITVSKSNSYFSDTGLWAFQDAGEIVEIDSSFQLQDRKIIGFTIGCYEESCDLIIDPIILYSTVLGNDAYEVAEDVEVENDYIYITGLTGSPVFPTMNAYNSTYSGNYDCFVTKFSPDGQSLIYSTFLGGSSWDWAHSLAVKDGSVYITGYTESSDFPTMAAYDPTHNGDKDCFVTKFSPDGQFLNYSTYIGGASADEAWSIVVDSGYAYITGDTYSS
ncbi:MAG: hypothetical protein ACFFBL_09630, partial [Promethearchaeota archaeon]